MKRCWCRTSVGTSTTAAVAGLVASMALSPAALAQQAVKMDEPSDAAAGEAFGPSLFLEARVNEVSLQELVQARVSGPQVWMDRAAIRQLGLRPEAIPSALWQRGHVRLDSLPDAQVTYDAARLRLALRAPTALLARDTVHAIDTNARAAAPSEDESVASGFLINYDVHLQRQERPAGHSTRLSAWSEWRAFQPQGVFSQTMVSQWTTRGAGPGSGPSHLRLDSMWRSDFPEQAVSLVLGDAVTSAPSWSRPVRLGGLRFGTDFALQPYRPTGPLTAFQGEALLPSTVALYLDGLLQEQLQVLPGTFTIESMTAVDGAGMARLVVTDVTGQTRVMDIPVYGSVELLREGLTDWSFELGAPRRHYGRESFAYASRPVASGTWRHGWNEAATLEGHAQWGAGLRLVGVGGVGRLGARGGVLSASLASSDGARRPSGQQATLGFHWSARPWRFSARSQRTSAHFRDLASLGGAPLLRRSDRVFLGLSQAGWDVGTTLMRQRDFLGEGVRLASLSLSRQMAAGWRWSLGLSKVRSTTRETRLSLSLMVPMERGLTVSTSAQRQGGELAGAWQIAKAASAEDDWAWRIAQTGPRGSAQLDASGRTARGQWAAALARHAATGAGGAATTVGASFGGAVVLMEGRAFLTTQVNDALTLVSTRELSGIPVKLENRPVGTTDAQGHLLVNRLNAHQRNQLSVDVLDLEHDVAAAATTLYTTPPRQGATRLAFALERVVSARAGRRDAQGRPIPLGSRVTAQAVAGRRPATVFPQVGHDGEILLENPAPGMRLTVHSPGRDACSVQLPEVPQEASGAIHLGELTCQ